MDEKDAQALRDCLTLFVGYDYDGCVRRGLPLLSTAASHHLLMQILVLSLQKLGRTDVLDQLGSLILKGTGGDPWINTLLRLTLAQAEYSNALQQAQTDTQRSQVHFCMGLRHLANAEEDTAVKEFQTCMELGKNTSDEDRVAFLMLYEWDLV